MKYLKWYFGQSRELSEIRYSIIWIFRHFDFEIRVRATLNYLFPIFRSMALTTIIWSVHCYSNDYQCFSCLNFSNYKLQILLYIKFILYILHIPNTVWQILIYFTIEHKVTAFPYYVTSTWNKILHNIMWTIIVLCLCIRDK